MTITRPSRYGHRPVFMPAPQSWTAAQREADHDRQFSADRAWREGIQRGLSLGHLTSDQARDLGWHPSGHATEDGTGRSLWQPLPSDLWHVTTDLPGVQSRGLLTRSELGQDRGHGLGGGEDDTISLTTDRELAGHILDALHEYHGVLTGTRSVTAMWEEAKAGTCATRPYAAGIARYYDRGWRPGEREPEALRNVLDARERYGGVMIGTPGEMHRHHGPGWEPADNGWDTAKGRVHGGPWYREASPDVARDQRAHFYNSFSVHREAAGGPPSPLFFSTDTAALAAKDPSRFAILHVRPAPGAQGYPLGGMSEWRTCSGGALDVEHAEQREARPDVAPPPDHAADAGWADVEAGG